MKNLLPVLFVLCALFSCKQTPPATQTSRADSLVSPGPDPIQLELATRMVTNYKPHIGQRARPDGSVVDNYGNTTSIWFDLKKLDSLVTLLKKERASNKKTDGIRVYFATYGNNKLEKPEYNLDTTYSYRNTLIFVSTKDSIYNGNRVHYDYFKNDKAFILTEPVNKGELCPPPVKCNVTGATLTP